MKAKLVKSYTYVRVYELSESISKGKSDIKGEVTIKESIDEIYKRLKPEYQEVASKYKKDGCWYIAISEATTHIETLVFPAVKIDEDKYAWVGNDIGGMHTMMIYGGDPESIHPDEVYIRRLAQLNNLVYEGLIEE